MEIIKKINPNGYRLKLFCHVRTVDAFNVKHLISFKGDHDKDIVNDNLDSRVNSIYLGRIMQIKNLYRT